MNHTQLKGLIAAPFTAFQTNGKINLPVVERQVESLVSNKVSGVFVCGTTGEGLSLSTEERQQLAERWRSAAGSKLRVIIHVGHTSLEDCRALASHAQKIGADAISCQAPCFFKPASVGDLVQFSGEVANAAPDVPFYYYHIPSMTGVSIPVADFLNAASSKIPTLVGVKFTYENLMDYLECRYLENGRYDMVFGRDEGLLAGLAIGSKAAIGSTYNFAAPIYHRLIAAFEKGDLETARQEQLRSVKLIRLLASYGFMSAARATMKFLGIDLGPARLPNKELSPENAAKLKKDLEQLEFFSWLK